MDSPEIVDRIELSDTAYDIEDRDSITLYKWSDGIVSWRRIRQDRFCGKREYPALYGCTFDLGHDGPCNDLPTPAVLV